MAQCVVCSSEIRDDARFCPSCGAEQPRTEVAGTDADPLMGKVVARKFKVEKLLGVGGMGKVYKARQLSLDKAVVVKVLHDHFREDPQLVQRFQREAKAASRLNHPNSIQIIDFGQDEGGVVFMAMEFLQGQDLFSVLKKDGPLPAERIAKIMMQACSALAEAHEQHVVHRDLKPENIMVEDRRGQKDFVKVLDFGIAKIQDPGEGQQALTQAGMVCGTPEYMSPEQARGLNLDARSDIYALGVVMYQLAVGELPFVSDTPIGIVTKHILEKPVPPRTRAPQLNIPVQLENIILKCMEKEAGARFNSVSELSDALEAMLHEIAPFAAKTPGTNAENSRPVPVAPNPTNPNNTQPATTKPTPTNQSPVVAQNDPPAASSGGGVKIAAAAFGAVVVLAIAAFVVVKLVLNKPDETGKVADAGVVVAVVHDAGTPTPSPNRPAAVDAGTVAANAVVDAGLVAEAKNPETKNPETKNPETKNPETKNPETKNPETKNPETKLAEAGAGKHAEADKIYKEAVAFFANDPPDCNKAMPLLVKSAKIDPSFGDPMLRIASCQKIAGNKEGACSAAKEYIRRKHPPADRADKLLAVNCN